MTKKHLLPLLFLLAVLPLSAQDITTMWPYMYPEFITGVVRFKDGQQLEAPVNVHLQKSRLHYLEKGEIKEARSADILLLTAGADTYYVYEGELLKVLAGTQQVFLAELRLADFNAILETGGAYGSSSNVQATRKLSSIEVGGIHITEHVELKARKDAGVLLDVTSKYYIVTGADRYPATRKGIESNLPDDQKAAFKEFMKQHKIKWKDPESLKVVLEFFTQP
jgi:hypothetical protein